MLKSLFIAAAALIASTFAQNPNATIAVCSGGGGSIKWSKLTINPIAPVAGDTVIVNATGISPVAVNGGSGQVNAYIYGVDMFQASFNTCGAGQQIDIDGATTATLDALNCPVTAGQTVTLGLVLPIPSEAQGLGQINITAAANDDQNRLSFCLDVVATV